MTSGRGPLRYHGFPRAWVRRAARQAVSVPAVGLGEQGLGLAVPPKLVERGSQLHREGEGEEVWEKEE